MVIHSVAAYEEWPWIVVEESEFKVEGSNAWIFCSFKFDPDCIGNVSSYQIEEIEIDGREIKTREKINQLRDTKRIKECLEVIALKAIERIEEDNLS